MDVQTKQTNLIENLQYYLDKACKEEEAGNIEEAQRLFRLALRCEVLSQPEKDNISGNVQQATPENGQKQLLIKLEIQEIKL